MAAAPSLGSCSMTGAGDWWTGGETGDAYVSPPGPFLVHVSIPEGYMNAAHKRDVQAWVTEAILGVTSAPGTDAGHSIQVILDEVPEGHWAAGGRTISLANIADSVGLSKTGSRFAWSKGYFAAKARARAAAGYPADAGGLWRAGKLKSSRSRPNGIDAPVAAT